ncbi:metallophosphoesterase family protein [Sphingomonas sp. AX6]|uniref:metallophosphoesterase family protein n=1 Tax=Sphingomonas sp. AX6 TaxID=2653171 RepID=UPI0012F215A9|nr:metallophosphoesterase family protein [Sphingomonas sp. AX6]VXC90513.1 Serine/threonine protein phosphatase [Sphingomonas sp. AX6]
MFKRLFSRGLRLRANPAAIPDGQRVYAIGDIHGCDDQLADLLARIDADDQARGGAPALLVFLGDLVDRGPKSAQVVQRLIDLQQTRGNCRFLSGNHEEVFVRALSGDLRTLRFFIRIGGDATLKSYGISEAEYRDADYADLLALAQQRVPPAHLTFIDSFEQIIRIGDYVFVHAGIRPDVALDDQKTSDLRWIREEFLEVDEYGIDGVIIHGHTIFDTVSYGRNRIGIDTGAYAGGPLTALGLENAERWILQTDV